MIRVLVGDLLSSDAQTLVNTVNCVGVMGKGIALAFKKRFPEMYQDYVERCARGQVRLGAPYLYRGLFPPYVLNFPTKDHWRSVSRLDDIIAGLEYLERHYQAWGITSLAVPPLGCGQGQLEWRIVGPTLYRYLSRLDIPVELYAPLEAPDHERTDAFLEHEAALSPLLLDTGEPVRIIPAWVALAEVVARIGEAYYHWPVGRVRFQKLAYFATAAGLPTGFEFQRASYGPFDAAIKQALTRLVNNGVLTEEQDGKGFILHVGPTYQYIARSTFYRQSLQEWEPIVARVTDLLLRIPTRDTELAATVHYVWRELAGGEGRRVPEAQVIAGAQEWKRNRTPPFDDAEIREAIRNLAALGWLSVEVDLSTLDDDDRALLQLEGLPL